MNAGVLQFALGLTSGGFISALGGADAKLKAFIGGMVSLGAITAGVWKQIEKGAGLKHLHDQTGESISDLYKMGRGLKAVGLDANSTGTMVFMLNKALGGVNEMGEPTAVVFQQIGLEIDKLKRLNAPQAILSIAQQLNKLDNSSATAAAGKIFGRYSAREFLQLARNAEEFSDALKHGAIQAAMYDKFGATFAHLEIGLDKLHAKADSIFLGLAVGVAPAIDNIVKSLNEVDVSKIGQGIGVYITALTQAFREGKLGDLIGESLKMGFDALVAYAPAVFEKIGFFLLKAMETPLSMIQAGMEYALTNAAHAFATDKTFQMVATALSPIGAAVLDKIGDTGGASWQEILKAQKEKGLTFDFGAGEFGLGDINADADQRFKDARAGLKDQWDKFAATVSGFAARAPQPDGKNTKAGNQSLAFAGETYRPKFTDFERMGFVMGGLGNPLTDHARNTARHTARLVELTGQMVESLRGGSSATPENAI